MTTATAPAFRANVAELLAALARIEPAAPARPPVPVLGGAVVDVGDDGTVRLSAFDYEASVVTDVEGALAKEPGRVVLDRAALLRIVKAAIKGETRKTWATWDVEVTATATTVVRGSADNRVEDASHIADVEVGGFLMPVEAYPPGDFPALPVIDAVGGFTVSRDALAALLARVGVAAGRDDTLPMLTGVRIEQGDGEITAAATDRFRLAVGTIAAESQPDALASPLAALLPRGPFVALVARMPAGPITVELDRAAQTARLSGAGMVATMRVLDGEFPRFRQLLPSEAPHALSVDVKELSKTLAKAVALADRSGTVRLSGDGESVRIAPYSSDQAEGRVRGAAVAAGENVDGLEVCVNGRLLLEAAKTFEGRLSIGLQQMERTRRPVVLAATTEDLTDGQAEYRHLVMPWRMAS